MRAFILAFLVFFQTIALAQFDFEHETCHSACDAKASVPLIDKFLFRAIDIGEIIVYGDSLSDTGNIAPKLLEMMPRPPYWYHRFSNFRVWVEYIAALLHKETKNYAYGGAESNRYDYKDSGIEFDLRNLIIPNLLKVVDEHTRSGLFFTPYDKEANNNLYVIWIGANNYLDKYNDVVVAKQISENRRVNFARSTVLDIRKTLEALYASGARNFLVPNLPDLGSTPWARNNNAVSALTYLSNQHNEMLAITLQDFEHLFSDVKLATIDVASLLKDTELLQQTFGVSNITDSCYTGGYTGSDDLEKTVCADPMQHLFWDQLHPTTKGHCMLAYAAMEALSKAEIFPFPVNQSYYVEHCSKIELPH